MATARDMAGKPVKGKSKGKGKAGRGGATVPAAGAQPPGQSALFDRVPELGTEMPVVAMQAGNLDAVEDSN